MNHAARTTEDTGIEARVAARMAVALTHAAQELPHDVTERLRFARQQALERARESRLASTAATATIVGVSAGGAASLSHIPAWHQRWRSATAVLPLLLLVGGLLSINHWVVREQVLTAADIDAQLLSDNLPPVAYSDPGFAEYLRSSPPP